MFMQRLFRVIAFQTTFQAQLTIAAFSFLDSLGDPPFQGNYARAFGCIFLSVVLNTFCSYLAAITGCFFIILQSRTGAKGRMDILQRFFSITNLEERLAVASGTICVLVAVAGAVCSMMASIFFLEAYSSTLFKLCLAAFCLCSFLLGLVGCFVGQASFNCCRRNP